ncbi:DUF3108 domain-containing protein [Alphaproteobacteria bacterium]|nr:DUF3108 domain-containing protein [Alphaproteobacteria bacterium]
MNNLSPWLSRSLLLAFCFLASPDRASASNAAVGELTYRAYYGGLSAVEIDARLGLTDKTYELSTSGRSIGFLDFLFPFQSTVTGRGGTAKDRGFRHFTVESTYKGKMLEITGLTGTNTAPVWTVIPLIPTDERDPVPLNLRTKALDPIAALFAAATSSTALEACSGTLQIFNGKVRTDVHLTHIGKEDILTSRFSIFSGAADKCEARYKVLAGGYKKSWFGNDRPSPVIQFWIARIDGATFWVPVRMEAKTEFAKVLVHLTAATISPDRSIKQR